MDADGARDFFGRYLEAFAVCARGEREPAALLDFYGVPFVLTSAAGALFASTEADVRAGAEQLIGAARAGGFASTEVLESQVDLLNPVTALFSGRFLRRRADGSEIERLAATYLITDGPAGRRMSALVLHG